MASAQADGSGDIDIDRLQGLLVAVTSKMVVVVIQLRGDQDPNEIFEKLNFEGQPLTVLDLVRNEVFKGLSSNTSLANTFHRSRWQIFENDFGGANLSAKEVTSLRDGFFFPFSLVQNPQVTKNNMFRAFRDRWAEQYGEMEPIVRARRITEELRYWVPSYLAVTSAKRPDGLEDDGLWNAILQGCPPPVPSFHSR